jgi:hypothetical protein
MYQFKGIEQDFEAFPCNVRYKSKYKIYLHFFIMLKPNTIVQILKVVKESKLEKKKQSKVLNLRLCKDLKIVKLYAFHYCEILQSLSLPLFCFLCYTILVQS